MTEIDFDRFWLQIESDENWARFWPKSKAIALVFCPKMTEIDFLIADWKCDEPVLAKK